MKISIAAKSSSCPEEPYTLDFIRENNLLSVTCSCAAGVWGKFCKHKWGLLSGNRAMLAFESEEEKLSQVELWVKESSFLSLYNEVNSLEEKLAQVQAQIKKAKLNAEKRMREGF